MCGCKVKKLNKSSCIVLLGRAFSPFFSTWNRLQPDSERVQTHHSQACGQCHWGVDPWPQRPLVKAVVVLVVGPQALCAVSSQDLNSEARCHQALWSLPQLQVEILAQAPELEVDCFAAASSVWMFCIWSQGSTSSPTLMMGDFMRDVHTLVVNLIWGYYFIFWMENKRGQEQTGKENYLCKIL